jgi:hypothetical protein
MSNTWSPQAAVLIVMPPAKPMPDLPPLFPAPPLLPAPPSPIGLPLFGADAVLQAASASAPSHMNTARPPK